VSTPEVTPSSLVTSVIIETPYVTTTVPKVCEDITELTESLVEKLPLSVGVSPEPEAKDKESDYEFTVVQGTPNVEFGVELEKGGILSKLVVQGTFSQYQVVIVTSDKETILKNTKGSDVFEPEEENEFEETEVENNGKIVLNISGPDGGYVVNITSFAVCIPEIRYCNLSAAMIAEEVGFIPKDGVVGVSMDDNDTVSVGDFMESGTKVAGNCYICECVNDTLECTIDPDCTTATVPATTPAPTPFTTEPPNCPGPWSEWSEECPDPEDCDPTVRPTRQRTCGDNCAPALCGNETTRLQYKQCDCVTEPTQPITTKQPECDYETEVVVPCYNATQQCLELCDKQNNTDLCKPGVAVYDNMEEQADNCSTCACKPGYLRDSNKQCVPECPPVQNCYTNGTYVPVGYKDKCYKCYDGSPPEWKVDNSTCCMEEWSEWSNCSNTCGGGTRSRSRELIGNCSDVDSEETESCNDKTCNCVVRNVTYADGEKISNDYCEECYCISGKESCLYKKPSNFTKECNKTCYCDSNGKEVCEDFVDKCQEIRENCNNETHKLEENPEDACCPKCVPVEKPCRPVPDTVETLNFTSSTDGRCVSEELSLMKCSGTCGISTTTGEPTLQQTAGADPSFTLVMDSDCACCQPNIGKKDVPFTCEGNVVKQISVSYIESCSCMMCGA